MIRLSVVTLVLAFASLQVLFAQEKGAETKKTNNIVIGKGQVSYPNSDVKKSNDTKEDPALKSQRREVMLNRKLARERSKANAREKANAVSRAGSQMVAGVVQQANQNRILQQRELNNIAGRQSSVEMTAKERINAQSDSDGSLSDKVSTITSWYQCKSCGKVWSLESKAPNNYRAHLNKSGSLCSNPIGLKL